MISKAEYLVIDSGGFLKNAPFFEIASNLVTLPEVIGEIKDKNTKQWIENMPFDIMYKQPTSEAVRFISEFARKTGDYASLSAVDIRVLAVTYDLVVEKLGTSHLRKEPVINKTTKFYHPKEDKEKENKSDAKLPGFFTGENDAVLSTLEISESFDQFNYWRDQLPEIDIDEAEIGEVVSNECDFKKSLDKMLVDQLDKYLLQRTFFSGYDVSCVDFAILDLLKNEIISENCHANLFRWHKNILTYDRIDQYVNVEKIFKRLEINEDILLESVTQEDNSNIIIDADDSASSEDIGYNSDQESDANISDGDDWITPGNLKAKKAVFTGDDTEVQTEKVVVACMTTDFAMQNVCRHLGLDLIGPNGKFIKTTKNWILRCYGCFKTTPDMDKKFCPKCGHKTLKRVSVTVNADGTQQIHISTRRPINTKGKKFSLPAPKGGKHAVNPKLFEDQRDPQQRLSKKALMKNNPMGDDFLAGSSPFVNKDVTSKSAMLGLHGRGKGNAEVPGAYWNKRNPNAVSKNTGNRKKK